MGYNSAHRLTELVIMVSSTGFDEVQHSPQAWEDYVGWDYIQDAAKAFRALRGLCFVSEDYTSGYTSQEKLEEQMVPCFKENNEWRLDRELPFCLRPRILNINIDSIVKVSLTLYYFPRRISLSLA